MSGLVVFNMVDSAKRLVLDLVDKLSELQLLDVCDAENLKLTKSKKDRKSALKNLVTRYISSEELEDEDDAGLAVFQRMSAQMKDLLGMEDDEDDNGDDAVEEALAKQLEAHAEQEERIKQLESDMEAKLRDLKTSVDDFGVGDGAGGSSDSALSRLAVAKTPDVDLNALVDELVTKRMKSEMLNLSVVDGGSGSAGKSLRRDDSKLPLSNRGTTSLKSENPVSTTTVTTELHKLKLREFKIANGTVGVEGSLDYSDLIMQMKEGLAVGYSEKEVMAGVIRATKPGSELRRYLVRKANMTYNDFKQTMREFYNVRESQSIMDEMREMVQGETQDLLKYVMSMCALRDEVFEVAASEDCPPGDALVNKRFVDSLLSGLRKPTVRLEMQALLKQDLSDPKLFNEVNQIAKRVNENEKKVGGEVQAANVKSVEVKKRSKRQDDDWRDETAAKLESLTAQVSRLEAVINKVAGVNVQSSDGSVEAKMSALLGQVQHLAAQMQEYKSSGSGDSGGSNNVSKFKFKKCDDCERERKFCRHCRKCKKEGHKVADCPEN